ncbi:MAG: hypothetical protein E7345_03990 [Clostridiales bacterium]|nr:hypothetical protein [Clostridiales bacterium]
MNRTANIKRNMFFNVLKFVTQIVLQFVLRTILIYIMGVEYLGLNGLFSNIFAFLNLAELGLGSAIVFSMYKPIAENDVKKIKILQEIYRKFYLTISIVVSVLGIAISPFLPFFIKDGLTISINIYILYFMYLINTLFGYFSAHKRSLLFAYERNDVENKIRTVCIIGMTLLQILVLVIFKDYYLFFTVNILFTFLESLMIYLSAKKLFPQINGVVNEKLDTDTKNEIIKNVVALSMHKVGSVIVCSTDSIIISSFLGAAILGAYSNYYMIISMINTFFALLISAVTASVGNMIATQTEEYVFQRYKIFNKLFNYLASFTTICLVVLFQPFIELWTGGGIFMLDTLSVLALCFSFYLSKTLTGVSIVKESAGIFHQDRWRPILEACINLGVSILLVNDLGVFGVVIGTIFSTLLASFIAGPYMVYKHYYKKSVVSYYKCFLFDFLIMIVACVITYFVCSFIPDGGILWLIVKFAVCILLSGGLLVLMYLPTKEFRELLTMGKNMLKGMLKKKDKSTNQ